MTKVVDLEENCFCCNPPRILLSICEFDTVKIDKDFEIFLEAQSISKSEFTLSVRGKWGCSTDDSLGTITIKWLAIPSSFKNVAIGKKTILGTGSTVGTVSHETISFPTGFFEESPTVGIWLAGFSAKASLLTCIDCKNSDAVFQCTNGETSDRYVLCADCREKLPGHSAESISFMNLEDVSKDHFVINHNCCNQSYISVTLLATTSEDFKVISKDFCGSKKEFRRLVNESELVNFEFKTQNSCQQQEV